MACLPGMRTSRTASAESLFSHSIVNNQRFFAAIYFDTNKISLRFPVTKTKLKFGRAIKGLNTKETLLIHLHVLSNCQVVFDQQFAFWIFLKLLWSQWNTTMVQVWTAEKNSIPFPHPFFQKQQIFLPFTPAPS